jgi:serine/threonine protein kinase
MPRYGKWETIDKIDSGGQGVVYSARDSELLDLEQTKWSIADASLGIVPTSFREAQLAKAAALAEGILKYGRANTTEYCGALKVLHSVSNSAEISKQLERMKHEIKGLRALSHPNIVRILDENLDEQWFVMELFFEGTLSTKLSMNRGDFTSALRRFRPLVEAVASMHEAGLVHRDIKPDNIFCSSGRLVLGDLGLVHFVDEKRTRISDAYENVGSRDWMPPWAMGMRLEDIRPSFDVFSLGKLLWAMASGKPVLQLWYLHHERFELEKMFPNNLEMRWARKILDHCIVEKEEDCLTNAKELLRLVDTVLSALERHSQIVGDGIPRICRVCGLGHYTEMNPQIVALQSFRMFKCSSCGHTELFFHPKTT